MSSQSFIGIDFGTTNSSAAWFNPKTGQAETLLNAEGESKTPSVVYFGEKEILVGKHAEERLEHPEDRKRVVIAAKRDLAKARVWLIDRRPVTIVDVAAEILKKLKRDAEETHFHGTVTRAVITCPAVFDEVEKDKLREAAAKAGFQEVEMLEEPVAAALAYSHEGMRVGRSVFVYDLGGGTFDLALLVREDDGDTFRLALAPRGDRIGGEDFDREIYDYFDQGFQEIAGEPICKDGVDLHLLRQCRRYKENLSMSEKPQPLSWWREKKTLKLKINRKRFEGLIQHHVDRTLDLTKNLRDDAIKAHLAPETVILIGGSSRIPIIQQKLREALGMEPQRWQKQDVAVALGAAYHASSVWGSKRLGGVFVRKAQVASQGQRSTSDDGSNGQPRVAIPVPVKQRPPVAFQETASSVDPAKRLHMVRFVDLLNKLLKVCRATDKSRQRILGILAVILGTVMGVFLGGIGVGCLASAVWDESGLNRQFEDSHPVPRVNYNQPWEEYERARDKREEDRRRFMAANRTSDVTKVFGGVSVFVLLFATPIVSLLWWKQQRFITLQNEAESVKHTILQEFRDQVRQYGGTPVLENISSLKELIATLDRHLRV